MDKTQFENWLKERKIFKLFFDGASKGNPGKVGGGGVIMDPGGKIVTEYSWNIGYDSNNMAEAYNLWQGLIQLKEKGVGEVSVFGDSRIIIRALNEGIRSKNDRLTRMLKRIRIMIKSFSKKNTFHILRNLNGMVDKAANNSMAVGLHELVINKVVRLDIPP